MLNLNQIYKCDCLEKLKELDDNSIDSIVTDPPYGYSFMGKDWDKAVVSVDIWKERLRVLKPGGFAFIMSSPRQDVLSKMIVNITEAGFKTDFTSIYWTYSSGFPKALNISKAIDKKLGKFSERKVISTYKSGLQDGEILNVKNNQAEKNVVNITESVTEQAKKAEGLYGGFQPKPAVEVFIVSMKPLEKGKNYTEQYLSNGKGVTDIDGCRIPYANGIKDVGNKIDRKVGLFGNGKENYEKIPSDIGRFPSNLISSDRMLDTGKKVQGYSQKSTANSIYGSECNKELTYESNSTNKYFDLDLWFEERIKKLPEKIQKCFPFMFESKPQQKEKNKGLEKNTHPTVKPIKLMSYLVVLGSREQDTILDPFSGSGSTLISAKINNRNYIGFELNQEYIDIAEARLKAF